MHFTIKKSYLVALIVPRRYLQEQHLMYALCKLQKKKIKWVFIAKLSIFSAYTEVVLKLTTDQHTKGKEGLHCFFKKNLLQFQITAAHAKFWQVQYVAIMMLIYHRGRYILVQKRAANIKYIVIKPMLQQCVFCFLPQLLLNSLKNSVSIFYWIQLANIKTSCYNNRYLINHLKLSNIYIKIPFR